MTTQNTSAIARAVELADGVENLAAACGVSAQAVYKWLKKGHPPTDRCESVELAVGGAVSRFDLLPPTFAQRDTRRTTDPAPAVGHAGRQPTSPHQILDTLPERAVVTPLPPEGKA